MRGVRSSCCDLGKQIFTPQLMEQEVEFRLYDVKCQRDQLMQEPKWSDVKTERYWKCAEVTSPTLGVESL